MSNTFGKYWNTRTHEYTEYPPIIVAIARAIWQSNNAILDRHLRQTTWEEIQDPRCGIYEAAIAVYKVMHPEFHLDKLP